MPAIKTLKDLLIDELRDLYSAEQQLVKALPKLAKAATNAELKDGITTHLEETRGHVERLEKAFEALDVPARAKTCKAMQGLVAEGQEAIDLTAPDPLRDACIIGAAQRVEHYEIAAYGTARAFAATIGSDDVADLLQETLDEEGETDKKLTELAETVNQEANASGEDEDDEEEKE
jgi:ferritin-like metal-binding protein YciE